MTEGQPLYLAKSAYLSGLQCLKFLWYRFNDQSQIPPPDDNTQFVFDQGHQVGNLAKQLFPGGIEVGKGIISADQVVKRSAAAVRQRVPLFEAGFAHQGAYARVDILNPAAEDAWDIIEVKSTTEAKAEHLPDLAFQRFVCAGAGLKIRNCCLLHVNSDYVRHGPVDPNELLVQEDVTDQLSDAVGAITSDLQKMFDAIRRPAHPSVQIGSHCDSPYACPLHDKCWSILPPGHIFTLARGGKRSLRLFNQGILAVKNIPASEKLSDTQTIQLRAAVSGQPQINKAAIASFLAQLHYPVSYLDFETFATAIPLIDHCRPYQQIPFQFSLHIARAPTGALEHHMYLAAGQIDPRLEFMERLVAELPVSGSVVTYNAAFEKGRLEECVALLPKFRPWWEGMEPRIVDLYDPFRSFDYYHPGQEGSASMKAVLPSLTGKGYDNLEIQEGGTASREFLRVTFGNVLVGERAKVRKQLEEYCGLDTLGMVMIVRELADLK